MEMPLKSTMSWIASVVMRLAGPALGMSAANMPPIHVTTST